MYVGTRGEVTATLHISSTYTGVYTQHVHKFMHVWSLHMIYIHMPNLYSHISIYFFFVRVTAEENNYKYHW